MFEQYIYYLDMLNRSQLICYLTFDEVQMGRDQVDIRQGWED